MSGGHFSSGTPCLVSTCAGVSPGNFVDMINNHFMSVSLSPSAASPLTKCFLPPALLQSASPTEGLPTEGSPSAPSLHQLQPLTHTPWPWQPSTSTQPQPIKPCRPSQPQPNEARPQAQGPGFQPLLKRPSLYFGISELLVHLSRFQVSAIFRVCGFVVDLMEITVLTQNRTELFKKQKDHKKVLKN